MSTSGGSGGGGSGTGFDFHGSGSPEGVVTAAVGKSYVDTTNGAAYFKETGAGNTGWVGAGGATAVSAGTIPGLITQAGLAALASDGQAGSQTLLTDKLAFAGSQNALQWQTNGTDGQQVLNLFLGVAAAFGWTWDAAGKTTMPGPIITAPAASHTAIAAFGQVAVGTPLRNTTGYDLLVCGNITVTAATAGVVNLGVGPSATPTVDPITAAFSTAALEIVGFTAVVPNSYYLSLTTSGTITVGTPVSTATPL